MAFAVEVMPVIYTPVIGLAVKVIKGSEDARLIVDQLSRCIICYDLLVCIVVIPVPVVVVTEGSQNVIGLAEVPIKSYTGLVSIPFEITGTGLGHMIPADRIVRPSI